MGWQYPLKNQVWTCSEILFDFPAVILGFNLFEYGNILHTRHGELILEYKVDVWSIKTIFQT